MLLAFLLVGGLVVLFIFLVGWFRAKDVFCAFRSSLDLVKRTKMWILDIIVHCVARKNEINIPYYRLYRRHTEFHNKWSCQSSSECNFQIRNRTGTNWQWTLPVISISIDSQLPSQIYLFLYQYRFFSVTLNFILINLSVCYRWQLDTIILPEF